MKGNRSRSLWVVGFGMAMLALAGCSRQEAADWKQATLADSSEAYQLFLQQHPHSAEATQAQARMQQLAEQRDWQIASAADTRDSYQLFLTQHADSKWAQEARIRIENFAQAGVSGGPALTAAAASPSATGAAEAGANDASAAQSGTAAGAPVAPAAAATSATSAASTVAAASAPAARAHAQHTTQRAHARLAHRARPAGHHVARTASHRAHAVLAHNSQPSRLLQLGAFHSRASAESEWRVLSARFSTLKGLHPRYVAAHSRSGRVYRLQVRVSSAAEASGVCASLRHHARPCVRVTA
ncbi:MAG TPA: SPOR domain-containing protein [Steroidobacteraceae bacterium]|nr:SPOR domain-containing protein [Steroidobacteraceae bacterium]